MKTIERAITIRAAVDKVFTAYVEHIDRWWPRQGLFRYSFAPDGTVPQHIHFEPIMGGRFYESFADGSEYIIGHIVGWSPPNYLAYTWRAPDWNGDTTIKVSFVADGASTVVTVRHSGFGTNGVPQLGEGYGTGLETDILPALSGWLQQQ